MNRDQPKLRVALVGCGQIADAHLQEIRKIATAEAVAVCDRHLDLAKQAASRFGVPRVFDDLTLMLRTVRPDVVHVTTPPASHQTIAQEILEAGCHVYIEKPFALDSHEADQILAAAATAEKLVCVGHDQLWDVVWKECRALLHEGAIGRVVHVDSIQGYDLSGPFGRAVIEDREHWVRRLPGGLFQNVMSHALYRITDLLPDEDPYVSASWFGEQAAAGLPTELRVVIRGSETSGSLVFTSSARPVQRLTRIYGTIGGLEVDSDLQLIRRTLKPRLPGALAKVEAPARLAMQAGMLSLGSIWRFIRSDLHYFAGMNGLFTAFYESILEKSDPPISTHEIRRVTSLMDAIFAACQSSTKSTKEILGVAEFKEA